MPWNIHIERRFHAFIFDLLNLANPKLREDKATKASTWYDCIILYLSMNNCQEEVYIIQAWANWRCLSSEEGNARAKKVGKADIRLPRLLV